MLNAALAMGYKFFITRLRYGFDALMSFIMLLSLFILVFAFLTGGLPTPLALGNSLAAMVVSYFAWQVAALGMNGFSGMIIAEAHGGTLEQLFLGRYGFGVAAAGHVASAMLFLLVQNFLLLGVMLLITGQRVYFDAGPVLAATVTLLLQGCGIGLITGGLALVVKQVQRAQETLFLGLILLVAIPVAEAPALVVAPLSLAADILRRTMVDGAPFGALAGDLALSAVLAIGYLVLGWSAFRLCERVVKARGSLALY